MAQRQILYRRDRLPQPATKILNLPSGQFFITKEEFDFRIKIFSDDIFWEILIGSVDLQWQKTINFMKKFSVYRHKNFYRVLTGVFGKEICQSARYVYKSMLTVPV